MTSPKASQDVAAKHQAALDRTIRDAVSRMHSPSPSMAGIAQAQIAQAEAFAKKTGA